MSGILVVCSGNVCRSPLAEGFLRDELARRLGGGAPVVSSAGTIGWDGSGAMEESILAARELGVDLRAHLARRLTAAMVEDADLVVCMAAEHREAIAAAWPEQAAKTFTIAELIRLLEASPAGGDVAVRVAAAAAARNGSRAADADVHDPFGDPIDTHREVAGELRDLSERLAAALVGDPA
jgi:protein-tyrosine phosphatase